MKTIKVNVTPDDIRNGEVGSFNCCPIALSLIRMGYNVRVCTKSFYIYDPNFNNIIGSRRILPDKAKKFIAKFDERLEVKPISFCLRLPK